MQCQIDLFNASGQIVYVCYTGARCYKLYATGMARVLLNEKSHEKFRGWVAITEARPLVYESVSDKAGELALCDGSP